MRNSELLADLNGTDKVIIDVAEWTKRETLLEQREADLDLREAAVVENEGKYKVVAMVNPFYDCEEPTPPAFQTTDEVLERIIAYYEKELDRFRTGLNGAKLINDIKNAKDGANLFNAFTRLQAL